MVWLMSDGELTRLVVLRDLDQRRLTIRYNGVVAYRTFDKSATSTRALSPITSGWGQYWR